MDNNTDREGKVGKENISKTIIVNIYVIRKQRFR